MKVVFGTKVLKFLSKSSKDNKERIIKKLKELEGNPFQPDVKKLKGEKDVYRMRVGEFRVLYKLIPADDVILVFRVDKRSRVYRRP
jgi:mRNA interferase RelE/StbE